MTNNFKIESLRSDEFSELFTLSDSELSERGIIRMTVDEKPGFPCRVSLEDAEIGEEVILLPYKYHNVNSPYQSSGPIFVRKIAKTADLGVNEIPQMLTHRLLSIRGFNERDMMIAATVTEGTSLKEILNKTFDNQEISYIHIHNAKPGCYNCVAERV
ncbi:MAG: hypothetical protein FD122_242 [Stygiobacter sp.]|nr:MAG: hypothetical protein FD122_242 [Stygiobacter sp.]KAF0214611.1 MAG: hypothetical protein FD178_2302 [Ignavibacteria bacterium]